MYLLRKARKLHGSIDFNGLKISIETGRSRVREWYNPHDGSSGMSRMTAPYGYIKGTLGTVRYHHAACRISSSRVFFGFKISEMAVINKLTSVASRGYTRGYRRSHITFWQ